MANQPADTAILVGYDKAVDAVRAAVTGQVRTIWENAGSWRDSDVDRLVALIVPRVQAGQIQIANLTAAYIAEIARRDGMAVAASGIDRAAILTARNARPAEVYRRPAVTMYTELAKGVSIADALRAGLERLAYLTATDLQLVRTHQAARSFARAGYRYTIRVPHGDTCALCLIASTQRYHKAQLMPIHPGCNCSQRRIRASEDPGQVLNQELVEQIHDAVYDLTGDADRSARTSDYRDLIAVRDHGEYGPTLTWRSQAFTGPKDL